jgi:rubrerythrin
VSGTNKIIIMKPKALQDNEWHLESDKENYISLLFSIAEFLELNFDGAPDHWDFTMSPLKNEMRPEEEDATFYLSGMDELSEDELIDVGNYIAENYLDNH